MSRNTEAYIYKASNHLDTFVTDPNGRPLKMDYAGTATLNGITYNTLKIGYREFYGTTFEEKHDYRQEWLLDNVAEPLGGGRDIELARLEKGTDTECRFSSTLSVRRKVVNIDRPAGWWDDHFSCTSPRSILLPDGRRLYNNAAIATIDAKFKDLGWRVPCVEDVANVCRYYGGSTTGHPAFPFLLIDKGNTLRVYGRTKMQDTQTSPYPMPQPYTKLSADGGGYIMVREPDDKSPSTLSCSVYSTSGYRLVWNHAPYVDGTSIIKLRELSSEYNFIVTRDISSVNAYTDPPYYEHTRTEGVRFGIKRFTDGYLVNPNGRVPLVVMGYYMTSQDFPTFYPIRLCRAPLKP